MLHTAHRAASLGAVAALAFGLMAPHLGHADDSRSKDYSRRAGYDYGYRDGLRHGRDDLRGGSGYDYKTRDYDRGENGYRDAIGHKGDYKKGYREGYKIGYDEGYRNSDRYSRRFPDDYGRGRRDPYGYRYPRADRGGWGYPGQPRDRYGYPGGSRGSGSAYDFGADRGYRDGLSKGESDISRSRSYDFRRHDDYDDADNGYRSEYGNKDDYRDGYRRGFERGYSQGYRGRR